MMESGKKQQENDNSIDNKVALSQAPQIDQVKLQMFLQQIRDNQNLSLGIVGGLAAAVVGALIWAVMTAVTSYQIGFMAIGVGFLVGLAVRYLGKGIDKSFGVIGALFSLLGCLLGNLLTACIIIAKSENLGLLDVVSRLTPDVIVDIMAVTFDPIDLLFYALAVYYGYRVSFRKVTQEELRRLVKT
jgi:hypothetical protein